MWMSRSCGVLLRTAATGVERQAFLGALESLNLALFVGIEHLCMFGGIEIQANHVGQLLNELRVIAQLKRANPMRLQLSNDVFVHSSDSGQKHDLRSQHERVGVTVLDAAWGRDQERRRRAATVRRSRRASLQQSVVSDALTKSGAVEGGQVSELKPNRNRDT